MEIAGDDLCSLKTNKKYNNMQNYYTEIIGNLCKEGLIINDLFRNYCEVRWEDPNFNARLDLLYKEVILF